MDLLQTVKKEGSRGGVNFKWEDVKDSQHRQNYLGHSVMAPVGRWQRNRDLNWYTRASDAEKTPEEVAALEKERRLEELKKVKEAEEDAMALALGLPVPDRSANTEPLGERKITQKEVNAALKDALEDVAAPERVEKHKSREHKSDRRRSRSHDRQRDKHRRRSGSRHRDRSRDHRHRRSSRDRRDHKPRSRSPYQRRRSRERSPVRRERPPYKDRSSRRYDDR